MADPPPEYEFEGSLPTRDDGHAVIPLFKLPLGAKEPTCIAILRCNKEAAEALWAALGSLVETWKKGGSDAG